MARGATPEACLAELMQKATGLCKAKGGSMHLTHAAGHMLGSYAIVGAHLPMAVGAAWSARLRGTEQVAVAFFGDGATNIGAFHEALNLAAVWRLPVIFVCENNLYMEYTPIGAVGLGAEPGRRPGLRAQPARPRSSTATTSWWSGTRSAARPSGPALATARPCSRRRPTATSATPHRSADLPAGGRGAPLAGTGTPPALTAGPAAELGLSDHAVLEADERAAWGRAAGDRGGQGRCRPIRPCPDRRLADAGAQWRN
jgi:pyruvate dehydrogenase E1 component alpha subunit